MLGFLVLTLSVCLSVLAGGCAAAGDVQPALKRYSFSRMQMGVRSEVTLYSADEPSARAAAVLAFDEINRLEDIFSDYRPKSELSRLSDQAGVPESRGGVQVSAELAEILRASASFSERSGGAFDITVGTASKLWRESRKLGKLPEPSALDTAKATIGWRSVIVDEGGRVVLTLPGTRLDLGGIAKGYAAQRSVDLLVRAGSPRCMVALAGDVVVGDPPPGTAGWRVAVGSGRVEGDSQPGAAAIMLSNAAVSTSGDAAQWVEIDGVRYAHILDPRTGLGSTRQRSTTVVARGRDGISGGTRADALSTACFLTCDDADAFARQFGVAVYLIESGRTIASDPLGLVGTP